MTLDLSTEEAVSAGSYKDYELYLTFADLSAASGADPRATIALYKQETSLASATWFAGVAGTATTTTGNVDTDGNPSFIWADNSASGIHATTSADFANGRFVTGFDGTGAVVRD